MLHFQLSKCTQVWHISLIYKEGEETKTYIDISTAGMGIYAIPDIYNGKIGNCILISTNRAKMEQLAGLLQLANYDISFDEYPWVDTIELIGSNGTSPMHKNTLFVRVDGKNPDHYFNK